MAKYGARYIKWAPFSETNAEPDNAMPNYGTAIGLSKLSRVSDSPTYAEGKLYGDDELAEYVNEFTENPIDVEVTDLSNAMAKAIYGAKGSDLSDGDLVLGADDAAPYGGFGFVSLKMVDGKKSYVGIFYPKCKAQPQGEEYNTKSDNISLATSKIHFVGSAAKNGAWKIVSPDQTTLEAAKTWLDGKFGKA